MTGLLYSVLVEKCPRQGPDYTNDMPFGFPHLGTNGAGMPDRSGNFVRLDLTGGSAAIMERFKNRYFSPYDPVTAGVLADRMDEYPEESSDDELRQRVVWALRVYHLTAGL